LEQQTDAGEPPVRVDLDHGFYLIHSPTGFDADEPLPLVICLHGTATTASDILTFWRSLEHTLPMIMLAPQGVRAGWREWDSALLDEYLAHLSATVKYDPERVLLTGHSAGGAMAFHSLYVGGLPASALAVTATYVPPTVKPEHVRQHVDVPVFYAVGESDINRGRMRSGLALLRENDATVTVQRPKIGHVLDPKVGQAAMTWFESVCRAKLDASLAACRAAVKDELHPARFAVMLEDVIRRRATQFADQVDVAMKTLAEVQRSGRLSLLRAEKLLLDGRAMDARMELLRVEERYDPSALAEEARRRRVEIEAMPQVAEILRIERTIAGQGQEDK
jgi:hypothetical protein